jgi:hypothetical protein
VASDPHGVWIGVGDWIDGTTPGHRFYDGATVNALVPDVLENADRYVTYCIEALIDILSPLSTRPGVILQGNHDVRRGIQWSGLAWALANRMGPNVQYGGDECLVRLRAETVSPTRGANVWVLHCAHGAGGGLLPGGKLWRHQRDVTSLTDADIAIRGHVHDSFARVLPIYSVSRKGDVRLIEKPRAFITAPGFMRNRIEGVNAYPATKTLPATDAGLIYLEVSNPRPGKKWSHGGHIRRVEAPF